MKRKVRIAIMLVIIIILSVVIIKIYDSKESIVIKSAKINRQISSMLTMMFETDNEGVYEVSSDTEWPTSGYKFNRDLSGCEHGGKLEWENKQVKMESSYADKCFVYFDKEGNKTITDIINSHEIAIRTNLNRFTIDTTGKLYTTYDNDGLTYYYGGTVSDNWVKFGKYSNDIYFGYFSATKNAYFHMYQSLKECQDASSYNNICELGISKNADIYWRIVRINGDGTMRLIYAGTEAPTEETKYLITGNTQIIGSSVINTERTSAIYTGYVYEEGNAHGTTQDSVIKKYVDEWYTNTFGENEHVAEGKFCNDRIVVNGASGTDTSTTYYFGSSRISSITPTLRCYNTSDILNLNAGIITIDEFMYVRGLFGKIRDYLYIGLHYWTMTPHGFVDGSVTGVFYVHSYSDGLYGGYAYSLGGVRPVINLKADTIFKAGTDGTWEHPYEVV